MTSIKMADLQEVVIGEEEDLFLHEEITCDKAQSLLRVDKFLMDKLEGVSRTRIQAAIDLNCITVNSKPIKSNYKVKPFDIIKLVLPRNPNENEKLEPEDIPLDVVFEDEHILVINKQAGLVVHPGSGNHNGTLVNALLHYLSKSELPIMAGNRLDRPGLVHRIDKDTTGLMVIAKTETAMTHLAKQFFDHSISRSYIALVWGEPTGESGTITGDIGRHPRDRMCMTVLDEGEGGKHAVTHYNVLEKMYYVTLVQCVLETGRTHQIRVHMKHLGNTLFNDNRYGGDRILKGTVFNKYKQYVENCFTIMPRQALHAHTLGFVHPVSGKEMKFEAKLPQDFEELLTKWRNYKQSRKEVLDNEDEYLEVDDPAK